MTNPRAGRALERPDVIRAMPVDLQFLNPSCRLKDQLIEVDRTENSFIQRPRSIDHEPTWQRRRFNPRLMRDQFQRAKTDKQIAAFLASCGPFMYRDLPQEIPRQEFLNCQAYIQAQRQGATPEAYPQAIAPDQVERICEMPEMDLPQKGSKFAIIRARTALELIGATVVLDRINEVRVGKCEQCGHLYDKENNRKRKYCDLHLGGRVAQNKARRKRVRAKKKRAARQPRSDNKPPATS